MPARERGKPTALLCMAAALALLAAAAYAWRGRIIARWHLWSLEGGGHEERVQAIEALGRLGPAAEAAAPALIAVLRQWVSAGRDGHPDGDGARTQREVDAALRALPKLGPGIARAVVQALEETGENWAKDPRVPARLCNVLFGLGDASLRALVDALETGSPALQRRAAYAIEVFGARAAPALAEGLVRRGAGFRALAADALLRLTASAVQESPEKALSLARLFPLGPAHPDRPRAVAAAAAEALGLDPGAAAALEAAAGDRDLTALLKAAAFALERLGPRAEAAMPHLIAALEVSSDCAPFAADALGRIGGPAVARLLELLERGSPKAQGWAESALWEIAARDESAAKALAAALPGASEPLRARLRRVLDLAGRAGAQPTGP
ncbi:MAG: hypothetical protein HY721_04250 [Planctomycetes bacterium]|nr:hypothetical protein [Planctomycetota bacterium]